MKRGIVMENNNAFITVNRDTLFSLNCTERSVYAVLISFCDGLGKCFPSLKKIAEKAKISVSTVQRVIKRLVAKGLITKMARKREDGGNTSNVYTVNEKKQKKLTSVAPEANQVKHINNCTTKDSIVYNTENVNSKIKKSEKINFTEIFSAINANSLVEIDAGTKAYVEFALSAVKQSDIGALENIKKLNICEIKYAIEKYEGIKDSVQNKRRYLLSMLLNAKQEYAFKSDGKKAVNVPAKKHNSFNDNFEQRQYDFNELEKLFFNNKYSGV